MPSNGDDLSKREQIAPFSFSNSALSACHSVQSLNPMKGMTSMIVRFSPSAKDLQRLQVGPIATHLPSFAALVSQQGYCNASGWLNP